MTALEFNHQIMSHEPLLKGFALKLTANSDDAKDLVQETYLKALAYRERMSHNTNIKGWMTTIMRNTFINNYRRSGKQLNSVTGNNTEYVLLNHRDNNFRNPENTYLYEELWKAFEVLSQDFREPFRLYIEGYKYKEIADMLNLKIGTVKSRIFTARKVLSKHINTTMN